MNLRHLLAGAWQDNPFPLVAAFLSVAQVSILMGSSDGTILLRILALALTLEMCVFILIANRYLLGYLITITGKRKDGDTDDHIRSAIFQCSVLLFAIINLYGGVFFAQI